jgi:aspartate aminotransferase
MKEAPAIRIQNLMESQTLAMARKSRELKAEGKDVISLSLGEPDFATPEFVKEAAMQAIRDDFSHYTAVPGDASLLNAISKKFQRDNQLEYSPQQIVASTGAKQSIINVMLSVVNPGDEVLLPAPYWVSYKAMVQVAEGVPVEVLAGVENDFKIIPEQLQDALTEKTRVMLFSSPCNPTGSVYERDELEALADVLRDYPNVIILSDEIYELINFGDKHYSFANISGMYDRTVTINGVSKGFAMTGWRLGYIGAPKWIADACNKIQGQFTSAPSSISQKAAEAAVLADPSSVDYMKEAFLKRRELVSKLLDEVPGFITNMPRGAFYFFPKVSDLFGKRSGNYTIENANDLCMYILNEEHVALVPGEAFGAPNYVRLSYATSEDDLKEAIHRIKRAVEKLI